MQIQTTHWFFLQVGRFTIQRVGWSMPFTITKVGSEICLFWGRTEMYWQKGL